MSGENGEIVRRLYRAMNAQDAATFAQLTDPELEWIPERRLGEAPVRGRERVIQFFSDLAEMFDEPRMQIERDWETGDQVLVFIRVTGSGTSSGAGFDIHVAHLWTLTDGIVARGEGYGDRDEALQAAGLSE
jgi:uncharacterized protein